MGIAFRTAIILLALAFGLVMPPQPDAAPALEPGFTWADGKLTVQVKDIDIKDVVAGISKATGIEIRIYDEVQGTVTYTGDKEPVEKVIDQVLGSVGYKNYVMAQEVGEARRIWILPKGKEIKDADAKGRMKVKGTLRNGKEIEYFPGEIVIGIHLFKDYETGLPILIRALEEKYGLQFVNKAKVLTQDALKYRILGGQDVLEIMRKIQEDYSNDFRITYVTPNGIGPHSLEMPNDDFHVWKKPKDWGLEARLKTNPHLRYGPIYTEDNRSLEYFEGEFGIIVEYEDRQNITYEDILALAVDENGILAEYSINSDPLVLEKNAYYTIYIPGLDDHEAFKSKLSELRKKINSMRSNEGTGVFSKFIVPLDSIPGNPGVRDHSGGMTEE